MDDLNNKTSSTNVLPNSDIDLSSYFKSLLEVRLNHGEFTNDEVSNAKLRLEMKTPSIISEDYFKNTLGRKWKGELVKCCIYIQVFMKVFRREGVIKPISSWSSSYQAYLPDELSKNEDTRRRTLSKILSQLSDLGIIEKITNNYAFSNMPKCYCYIFNKNLGKDILKWVKNNIPDLHDEDHVKKVIDKKYLEALSNVNNENNFINEEYNKDTITTNNKCSITNTKYDIKSSINYTTSNIKDKNLDQQVNGRSSNNTNKFITNTDSYNNSSKYKSYSTDKSIKDYQIKITSKTRLPSTITYDDVIYNLDRSYPYMPIIMDKVSKINLRILSNNNFTSYGVINYKPKLHYSNSGNITKISIRAYSPLSNINARSNLSHDELSYIETREDILLKEWFNINITSDNYDNIDYSLIKEFDIKSSVPRVAYLLSHGEWLDNSIDLYNKMFGDSENTVTGYMYGLSRSIYKELFMYLYFSHGKSNAIRYILNKINCYEDFIRDAVANMYDRMESVIGPSIGSEIFLHESNIYILVRDILLNKYNIDCVQVYDAFILKSNDANSINLYDIVKECAMDYTNNYLTITEPVNKIMVVSDYHIDNYRNYSPTEEDYTDQELVGPKSNYRLNQSVTFAKALVKYGMDNNIKYLFLLGDSLNKANSGPKVVNTGAEVMSILRSWFTTYYILGQHDLASRSNNPSVYDTFMTLYSKLSGVYPLTYVHDKKLTFTNTSGQSIVVSFKNYQFETKVVDFGDCDIACGHLSLNMGQESAGTHKLGIFGDIHDTIECINSSGGTNYSVGTPYQLYPSQPDDGHFGVIDITNKESLKFIRHKSDELLIEYEDKFKHYSYGDV